MSLDGHASTAAAASSGMLLQRQHLVRGCGGGTVVLDDLMESPEHLLARAAEHDARLAHDAVATLSNARLLEIIVSQAQLAVEPGRTRAAGIDAIADLDRAAVELMGMPAGAGGLPTTSGGLLDVTGWELLTLGSAGDLVGATTSVAARPWHLALIAFDDQALLGASERRVTAVTADMRFVAMRLRSEVGPGADACEPDDVAVLDACVTSRLDDLGTRASLAWGLWCALAGAVEQR
jgi:hypothetical protein